MPAASPRMKDERVAAAKVLHGPGEARNSGRPHGSSSRTCATRSTPRKIISYAQGYMLMRGRRKEYNWNLNYGGIALMWRGGCIIRARFLGDIKEAYDKQPEAGESAARRSVFHERDQEQPGAAGARSSPPPSSSASRCPPSARRWPSTTATAAQRLPANLLQAQRDYFGAHTYERIDKPARRVLPSRLAVVRKISSRRLNLG